MKAKKVYSMLIVIAFLILCLTKLGIAQVDQIVLGNVAYPEKYTLTVTKSGSGTGTITSSPAGIDCGSVCSFSFNVGSTVTLTATPDLGSDFVQWSGDATGTDITVDVVMDSNKTVNAEFWAGPKQQCLVGWYKFNEGSGSTVINYAPDSSGKLPNLTVYNVSGYFWSVPGFGYVRNYASNATPVKEFAYAQLSSTKTFGGSAYGGAAYALFYKRNTGATDNTGGLATLYELNSDAPLTGTEFDNDQSLGSYRIDFGWLGGTATTSYGFYGFNRWMFMFYTLSAPTYHLKVAKDDGTLANETGGSAANWAGSVNLNWIHVGVRHNVGGGDGYYAGMGTFGDLVIYNGCTLTQSEWGQWYDHLRTRYGMSARTW